MAITTSTKYGPIGTFLDKVSRNWGLSFIFTKIWAVKFAQYGSYNDNLANNILSILKEYDDTNNFKSFVEETADASKDSLYYNLLNFNDNKTIGVKVANEMHFALANKITLPEEKMSLYQTSNFNVEAKGGIIQSRIGGNRLDNVDRTVDITFLDTNKEFYEYVIKPWIIANAHRGLIECKELPNLKCNIITSYFAKSSPNNKINTVKTNTTYNILKSLGSAASKSQPMVWTEQTKETEVTTPTEEEPKLRKRITFHGCVPISVPSKSYNYSSDMGIEETMTTVKFSYEYYTVENTTSDIGNLSFEIKDLVNSINMTTEGAKSTLDMS